MRIKAVNRAHWKNPSRYEKWKKLKEQKDKWPARAELLLLPFAIVAIFVFMAIEVFKCLFLGDA